MDRVLEELVDDSILIASFGQRTGAFANTALFEAIQAVSAAPQRDWAAPEVVMLQAALNDAVKAIRPVTLVDLRSGWSPFPKPNATGGRKSDLRRISIVALAILLMVLCAHYTIWQKRAVTLLADHAATKAEQQRVIINDFLPLLAQADEDAAIPDRENPGSLTRTAIRHKIEQVRAIEAAIVADNDRYFEVLEDYNPLFSASAGPSQPPATRGAATAAGPDRAGPTPVAADTGFSPCFHPAPPAAAEPIEAAAMIDDRKSVLLFNELVGMEDALLYRLRCILGLNSIRERSETKQAVINTDALSQRLDVLGLWILPGLYGMLGAVIFHLRTYLNPFRPDPTPIRVILRVFLGGFAGIAIAWFWSPEASDALGVAEITLGTLTLAFLLGFGIDVFFALLDRLVTVMTASIGRLGAAA